MFSLLYSWEQTALADLQLSIPLWAGYLLFHDFLPFLFIFVMIIQEILYTILTQEFFARIDFTINVKVISQAKPTSANLSW